jgi:hypothetical protein
MKSCYPDTGNYIAVIGKLGQNGLAGKVQK